MAIWLWILAAWILSYAALGGKKLQLEHLVWLLLPVDMYGIQIAGVTVKPYMLLCFVLLVRALLVRKSELSIKSRWSLISGIIALLFVLVNMFNNSASQSVLAACMLPVVWICSLIYLNDCDNRSVDDIPEAALAAGIGYGITFALVHLLILGGLELPGMIARTRTEPGIFMQFGNMYQGELVTSVRLRGFSIDPNTMVGTFLFSMVISLLRITTGKGGVREMLGLFLSVLCIILSNSRMGLICCAVTAIGSVIAGYKMADQRMRSILKVVMLFLTGLLILISTTDIIENAIQSILLSFETRSGLNDEYGRFTIWKEAFSVLSEQDLFFGIGMGQMQYYTITARACHNTWLEIICATGLLIGGPTIVYFGATALSGFRYAVKAQSVRMNEFVWTMVLGVLGVMIALVAVDNVTSSYLWFGMSLVAAISNDCWRE